MSLSMNVINSNQTQLRIHHIMRCVVSYTGGAERLIVDAALELKARGHSVHVFTAHHDRRRCFKETADGRYYVSLNRKS